MLIALLNKVRQNRTLYETIAAIRDGKSWLTGILRGSFAQHGEDKFIADFFGNRPSGFYIDIGASHPFRISNTFGLYRAGWRGITVEPIPRLVRLHRRWRPEDTILPSAVGTAGGTLSFYEMTPSVLSTLDRTTAERYQSEGLAVLCRTYPIDVIPINDILAKALALGGQIDLLSIDIEGLDIAILSKIDFSRFRPALICLEISQADMAGDDCKPLLEAHGYWIVRQMGCNIFAAPKEARPAVKPD